MSIFNYLSYIKWIEFQIEKNRNVYGYKSRLAEAAGCQKSFLSQVLSGSVHLTPDHGAGLSTFWVLSETESEYFLDLIHYARAGTPDLKSRLKRKLERQKQNQENFKIRYAADTQLTENSAAIYYSAWNYIAVHMLLTIPQYQNVESLGKRLNVSTDLVSKSLRALEQMGLAAHDGVRWSPTSKLVHLPRESHFNSMNHSHWRTRAVNNSFNQSERDVHYTGLCAISVEDAAKLKELMLQLVDSARNVIIPSKEEDLFCLSCDFFKV